MMMVVFVDGIVTAGAKRLASNWLGTTEYRVAVCEGEDYDYSVPVLNHMLYVGCDDDLTGDDVDDMAVGATEMLSASLREGGAVDLRNKDVKTSYNGKLVKVVGWTQTYKIQPVVIEVDVD